MEPNVKKTNDELSKATKEIAIYKIKKQITFIVCITLAAVAISVYFNNPKWLWFALFSLFGLTG